MTLAPGAEVPELRWQDVEPSFAEAHRDVYLHDVYLHDGSRIRPLHEARLP